MVQAIVAECDERTKLPPCNAPHMITACKWEQCATNFEQECPEELATEEGKEAAERVPKAYNKQHKLRIRSGRK